MAAIKRTVVGAGILITFVIASLPLFPMTALVGRSFLGRVVSNILYFWPQYVLWPNGIIHLQTGASKVYLKGGTSIVVSVVLWGCISIFFGWISMHWKIKTKALLAIPFIIAAAILISLGLYSFGFGVNLEGP